MDDLKELLSEISKETDTSIEDLAVGFAYLAQESKPLRVAVDKGLDNSSRRDSREDDGHRDRSEKRQRKTKAEREAARADVDMEIYRLEAGIEHGVGVKDIVGAVANELEIDSEYIGEIRLDEDCSYVELPSGMPKELQAEFKKVRVRGQVTNAAICKEDIDMGKRTGSGFKPKKRRSGSDKPSGKSKRRFSEKTGPRGGRSSGKRKANRPGKRERSQK